MASITPDSKQSRSVDTGSVTPEDLSNLTASKAYRTAETAGGIQKQNSNTGSQDTHSHPDSSPSPTSSGRRNSTRRSHTSGLEYFSENLQRERDDTSRSQSPAHNELSQTMPGGTPSPSHRTSAEDHPRRGSIQSRKTRDLTHASKDLISTLQGMTDEEKQLMRFTVDQQATIHNYFIMYDADGSAALARPEILLVFRAMDRAPKKENDEGFIDYLISSRDSDGDGELEFDEFLSFMSQYYSAVYKRAFLDNSIVRETSNGKVTKLRQEDLRLALHQIQEAGFRLRYEHLDEVIIQGNDLLANASPNTEEEAKEDDVIGFSFEQFHDVLEYFRNLEFSQLRQSAGFDAERIAFIKDLFHEADTDGSGCLDIREIAEQFLKAHIPITDVDLFIELFARMDTDKSASLNFNEFVRLMSIYSKRTHTDEVSESAYTTRTRLQSLNRGKTKHFEETARHTLRQADEVFHHLQSAHEITNSALIENVEVGTMAHQWGLAVEDVQAMRETFEFCDVDGSGCIDQTELKCLLENLGFKPNTAFQQSVFHDCLASGLGTGPGSVIAESGPGSGGLKFLKCVQWVIKYFDELVLKSFESSAVNERLPKRQIVMVLYQMGQYVGKAAVDAWLSEHAGSCDADIDKETFSKLVSHIRSQSLAKWRKTYGFHSKQIEHYKKVYSIACEGEDGSVIENLALERVQPVLEKLGYLDDPLFQGQTLLNSLARVYNEQNGTLTFDKFLLLLRHLDNGRALNDRKDEDLAIKNSGLDPDAVKLFREAFNSCPKNDRGQVIQQEIKIMLSKYQIVITQEQRRKLNAVMEDVRAEQGEVVSFANFLRILSNMESTGAFHPKTSN
eukprot:gnl/MRDRNA2_/MRDRNA2_36565_c0_seq1.p1 gnl/MRDRNA2_/MRDRNA2_36565_c0~~gnl/MRDRNA2_/MRDRNA2_36565_c0_seq1.p1  ORF type:complete len:994 (+),score=157.84 gnl/MRDRNA2_/MRDRNA2_36565_c0_seq1:448-2982(+)